MRVWAFTVPGGLLFGWLSLLTYPAAWPFYVATVAIPPVALSAVATWLLACNLYRRWQLPEIGEQTDVQRGVQAVQIVSNSVFGFDTPAPKIDYSQSWRTGVIQFATIGDSVGFPERRMVPHYVSRGGWDRYTELMVKMQVLVKGADTRWAEGWTLRHFTNCVRHEVIALPHPNRPAPRVEWTISPLGRSERSAHSRRTRIIEMEAVK